ncbi:MAG: phosphoglycolate phosphatase [Desulfurococcales archaeon]|nr:phosphoglycolate phosphatase [Desulfurococcales archaeon]
MIRLVVTDIDGTLTRRRGDLLLELEAVEAIRLLESRGVTVSLASGNSLPVTAGVARYIGARGPVIGENGCLVLHQGIVHHVCRGRPGEDLIEALESLGLSQSWQNMFRMHDLSFNGPRELLYEGARLAEEMGYAAYLSGYALHVQPRGGGKDAGLRYAARLLDVGLDEVAAVGDGGNDIPMLRAAGFSAAPGDADEEVKSIVDYVASQPGGRGFSEVARLILSGRAGGSRI